MSNRLVAAYHANIKDGADGELRTIAPALWYDPKLMTQIGNLRDAKEAGNEALAEKLKSSLPAFALSTTDLARQNPEAGVEHHTGLFQVDIDHADDVEQVKKILGALSYIIAAFQSPSGNGVKGIAFTDTLPTTVEGHKAAFMCLQSQIEKETGFKMDDKVKDPKRLFFCSYDHAPVLSPPTPGNGFVWEMPKPQPKTNMEFRDDVGDWVSDFRNLPSVKNGDFSKGHRNDSLFRAGCGMQSVGYSDSEIRENLLEIRSSMMTDPLPDKEVETILAQVLKKPKGERKPYPDKKGQPAKEGKKRGDKKSGGKLHQRADEHAMAKILLDMEIEVRLNIRSKQVEKSVKGADWTLMDDDDHTWLRYEIARGYSMPGKDKPKDLLYQVEHVYRCVHLLARQKKVDPVIEYLDALPDWDGKTRLPFILDNFFDTVPAGDARKLVMWCSEYAFIGAVQRSLFPGCQLDEMPVLVGKQGIGKSELFRQALPEAMRDKWFSSGIDVSQPTQKIVESTDGRLICELSEMTGMRKAEVAALKQYLTKKNDGDVRKAYARIVEDNPRRFVLVGTTNDPQCLPNDATGNRRYVVVHLTGKNGFYVEKFYNTVVSEEHGTVREQLWAEAYHRVKNGERANLPRQMHDIASVAAEEARFVDDSFDVEMRNAVEKVTIDSTRTGLDYLHLNDVDRELQDHHRRKDPREKAAVLRSMGYEKCWRQKKRAWKIPEE